MEITPFYKFKLNKFLIALYRNKFSTEMVFTIEHNRSLKSLIVVRFNFHMLQ